MKGEKCELRPLEESDNEAQLWWNGVMRGLTTEHLFTGSKPMRVIDVQGRWKAEREAGDVLFGVWSITPCESKEHHDVYYNCIGTCGLHSHREIYRSWEARFLIFDADAVGKGIGKEVTRLLTGYAFKRLNAHRVWLGVSEDNLRAVKCYLDCGYRLEGRLRDELYYDGKYHAALRMSVLEDEWSTSITP